MVSCVDSWGRHAHCTISAMCGMPRASTWAARATRIRESSRHRSRSACNRPPSFMSESFLCLFVSEEEISQEVYTIIVLIVTACMFHLQSASDEVLPEVIFVHFGEFTTTVDGGCRHLVVPCLRKQTHHCFMSVTILTLSFGITTCRHPVTCGR